MFGSFRVPARSLTVTCYLTTFVCCYFFVGYFRNLAWRKSLIILGVLLTTTLFVGTERAVLFYGMLLFIILGVQLRWNSVLPLLVATLAGTSLSYSRNRMVSFVNGPKLTEARIDFRKKMDQAIGDRAEVDPLRRSVVDFRMPYRSFVHFGFEPRLMDESTLAGFQHLSERMKEFIVGYENVYMISRTHLFSNSDLVSPVLRNFYNIKTLISSTESEQSVRNNKLRSKERSFELFPGVKIIDTGFQLEEYFELAGKITMRVYFLETWGKFWFPINAVVNTSVFNMARELKALENQPYKAEMLKATAMVEERLPMNLAGCDKSQASIDYNYSANEFKIKLDSWADCLLVLPMNYSPKIITQPERKIIPVYGILTGLFVPAGNSELTLSFNESIGAGEDLALKLSAIILLGLIIMKIKKRSSFVNKAA
jgi:hypothetical protein